MRINPRSALVGAASLGVVLLTISAFQTHPNTPHHSIPISVVVEGIPTPSQMMRVVEGAPFIVPDGKAFVATGIAGTGSTTLTKNLFVRFNGVAVLAANAQFISRAGEASGAGPAIPQIPPGLVARQGVEVSVEDPSGDLGVLLGYLADGDA